MLEDCSGITCCEEAVLWHCLAWAEQVVRARVLPTHAISSLAVLPCADLFEIRRVFDHALRRYAPDPGGPWAASGLHTHSDSYRAYQVKTWSVLERSLVL